MTKWFKVNGISEHPDGSKTVYLMSAEDSGTSGALQIDVTDPEALPDFVEGAEFDVSLSKV